jgi:hypothetical protein
LNLHYSYRKRFQTQRSFPCRERQADLNIAYNLVKGSVFNIVANANLKGFCGIFSADCARSKSRTGLSDGVLKASAVFDFLNCLTERSILFGNLIKIIAIAAQISVLMVAVPLSKS